MLDKPDAANALRPRLTGRDSVLKLLHCTRGRFFLARKEGRATGVERPHMFAYAKLSGLALSVCETSTACAQVQAGKKYFSKD